MTTEAPVWLTVVLSTLTGIFALAGHAISGAQARRSQRELFEAQETSKSREGEEKRLEDLFGRLFTLFNQTHEAVVRYRYFKKGLMSAESVKSAVGVSDDENYTQRHCQLAIYLPKITVIMRD
jgi:hypothetical protein